MGKNTKIRQLIVEKFGYVTDLPKTTRLHDDVTERNGRNGKNAAYKPIEEWRKVVKAVLGATTTEEDGLLENSMDFTALRRLANKHGFSKPMEEHLNVLEIEFKKSKKERDADKIQVAWKHIKDKIPYWFLGLLPNKNKESLPEDDKKLLTNLFEIMNQFNARSEKAGTAAAKDTPKADRDTKAKKNLDKARKGADVDTEAGSEKKLSKKSEVEVETKATKKSLEEAKAVIKEPKEENTLHHAKEKADEFKPKGKALKDKE